MKTRTLLEIALLLAIAVLLNHLAARHYWRSDWTRGRTFALSDKSQRLIRALDKDVDVIVFMLPSGRRDANDLYGDVRELLERARRLSPRLHVEYVDIDREPERLKRVGKKYKVSGDDLVDGVIVVAAGEQSKFITREDLAEYDWAAAEPDQPPPLKAWKGEAALDQALLAVTDEHAPNVCFVSGHGEPSIESFSDGDYGNFAEELKRDHEAPRAITLEHGVPADCDVVVVAGPQQPVPAADATELAKYLERGGKLLALMGPTLDPEMSRFVDVGIEPLLERWGAALGQDVVVDEPRLRSSVVAFAVSDGYEEHAITRGLRGRRTLWTDTREVRPLSKPGLDARSLLHSSDASWGETDMAIYRAAGEARFDPARDAKGPLSLGVAVERTAGTGKGARLVVLGSDELPGTRELLAYNRDLLLSSLAWLETRASKVAVGPRPTEHVHLSLDDRQLSRVFLVCVILLPMGALLVGGGVFWRRRR
jgi:ABC-2 type transport system permease protein